MDIFKNFPEIELNNFLLRQFIEEDSHDLFEYLNLEKVNRFIPNECIPRDINTALEEIRYNQNLFKYRNSIYWAIEDKNTKKLIGSCGFNFWNQYHNRAEISYDLAYDYWGKGIMTLVVKEIIKFAFDKMNINRIEATIGQENIASIKLLEKLGFIEEGILREQKILHGKYYDAIMYSLILKDYEKNNEL